MLPVLPFAAVSNAVHAAMLTMVDVMPDPVFRLII